MSAGVNGLMVTPSRKTKIMVSPKSAMTSEGVNTSPPSPRITICSWAPASQAQSNIKVKNKSITDCICVDTAGFKRVNFHFSREVYTRNVNEMKGDGDGLYTICLGPCHGVDIV